MLLSAALVPALYALHAAVYGGGDVRLGWTLASCSLCFVVQEAADARPRTARNATRPSAGLFAGCLLGLYGAAAALGAPLPALTAAAVCGALAVALHFGGAGWQALGVGTQERLILTQGLVFSCWMFVAMCYAVLVESYRPESEAAQVRTAVALLLGGCGVLAACAIPLLVRGGRVPRTADVLSPRSLASGGSTAWRGSSSAGPSGSPTAAVSGPAASSECIAAPSPATATIFYAAAVVIIACIEYPVLYAALGGREPVAWVLGDVVAGGWGWVQPASSSSHTPWPLARLALFGWWGVCLAAAAAASCTPRGGAVLAAAWRRASALLRLPPAKLPPAATLLLVRKAFHVLAVALFLPGLAAPPASGLPSLLSLGLAVAFKLLLCAELARALRLPPAGLWGPAGIGGYMRRFTDARDAPTGCLFILTHLYLAAGCGIPVWAGVGASEGGARGLLGAAAAAAGVTALGLGDAAAAAVGVTMSAAGAARKWGSLLSRPSASSPSPPLPWANKTLEGSGAYVAAASAGTLALLLVSALSSSSSLPSLASAAALSLAAHVFGSAVETFTDAIDNAVVPLATMAVYYGAMVATGQA